MAEKSDEDIIKEFGLETLDELNPQEVLDQLSLDDDKKDDGKEDIVLEEITLEKDKTDKNKTNSINNNVIENEDRDEIKENKNINNKDEEEIDEKVIPVQKKQPKIFKVLISVAVFLFLILITGLILYYSGFFDSKKPIKPLEENNISKKIKDEINFDANDINKTRLNKKLNMLTKHEIMNKDELESEENRIKEEERLKKEAEEKALLEKKEKEDALVAAQLEKLEKEKKILEDQQRIIKEEQEKFLQIQTQAKEELLQAQAKLMEELNNNRVKMEEEAEVIQEESYINEAQDLPVIKEEDIKVEEIQGEHTNKSFLPFINVATIKGELYKSYLDKVQKYSKNISLCRDQKNRIEIYFGPFDSLNERKKVFDNLLDNGFKESYLIDFTNEEYQKRCKY